MQLKNNLRCGDLLLQYDNPWNSGLSNWFNLPWIAAYWGITNYQEKYFGKKADTASDHVMTYIDDAHIVNAKPLTIKWSIIDDLATAKIKVFRPNFYNFTEADAALMIKTFSTPSTYIDSNGKSQTYTLIGSDYDWEQCIDILLAGQLGKPCQESYELIGGDKSHMVCSTSAATFFEKFRQLKNGPYPPVFSKIKPEMFIGSFNNMYKETFYGQAIVDSFQRSGKVAVEEVTPAHFANSNFFDDSFVLVGQNF